MNVDSTLVRRKSIEWLAAHNVPNHPNLPLLGHKNLRSSHEVAQRVVALYCMAGIANGADSAMLLDWLEADGGINCLEPAEIATLLEPSHSEERLNELSWIQESLYTLCWCCVLVEELSFPNNECDLSGVFSEIPPERNISEFVSSITLRDQNTIFQALDCYYCLHAALVHPELWGNPQTKSIPLLQIVLERRHALEWIFSRQETWGDIVLDT